MKAASNFSTAEFRARTWFCWDSLHRFFPPVFSTFFSHEKKTLWGKQLWVPVFHCSRPIQWVKKHGGSKGQNGWKTKELRGKTTSVTLRFYWQKWWNVEILSERGTALRPSQYITWMVTLIISFIYGWRGKPNVVARWPPAATGFHFQCNMLSPSKPK